MWVTCTKRKKKKNFSVTCITTYSPNSHTIRSIFNKHWHILKSDSELSTTFQDVHFFVFKCDRNLRDRLVRHSWALCPMEIIVAVTALNAITPLKITHFSHPHTGKRFPIKSVITCSSTHVIYMLLVSPETTHQWTQECNTQKWPWLSCCCSL